MADQFELSFSGKLKRIEDVSEPSLFVYYGPYGSGKSHLAASVSEVEGFYPVLIIDNEGSTTGTLTDMDSDRVDILRIDEAYKGNEWIAFEKVMQELLTKKHKYKTVIIDTMNSVFEWGKKAGDQRGDGFAKWNFVHDKFTSTGSLIEDLRNAPFLAIMILHENKKGGGEEGQLEFADFRWQGQGVGYLGQHPDLIGYITRDTNSAGVSESTLSVAPNKRNNAKNRHQLPAKIKNPSFAEIYRLIQENHARIATNKKENN